MLYTAKPCVSVVNTDHVMRFDAPRFQAFSLLAGVLLDVMFPERFQRMTPDILLIQLQPFGSGAAASYFPYFEDKSVVSTRSHG